MNPPLLAELPYHADTADLFEAVADEPWALFFDSAQRRGDGRYDIVCARPYATVTAWAHGIELVTQDGMQRVQGDALEVLKALLGESAASGDLPFAGGAAGYFSYDLGRHLEGLPAAGGDMPHMAVGLYDWALVVDHEARRSWLAGQGRDAATHAQWQDLVTLFSVPFMKGRRPRYGGLHAPVVEPDGADYARAFARIRRYIVEGDCYQVNLARRFTVAASGDPWEGYRRLRRDNPAPFGAYLHLPGMQVLSASPERFLQVRDGQVETRPIKGTRPRAADAREDGRLAEALRTSPKDRAENLMIVDLLRNDLGKACAIGSVAVPALFEVESFATVHHLVSTVTGRLAPGRGALDLLRACLPGGSITGVPKRRAMEIIEELEPGRRGVYCGAIGYVGFDGAMDTSIAIRTLVQRGDEARFWAGGG
ncbi:MAG: aminodeoxychorismate synthase component I, partial [Thiohalomonadaceae bacterium]